MLENNYKHIILSQDFFPVLGGAHLWLYEVYKRWPSQVKALVFDYSSYTDLCERQKTFDESKHGSLSVDRHGIFFQDLNFFDLSFLKKCWQLQKFVESRSQNKDIVVHSLRGYPEAFVAAVHKKIKGNKPKLITYAHGEEVLTARTSRQLTWMAKLAYSSSDCIIANSQSTKKLVLDFFPHPNIHIINPGVDCSSFQVSDQERLSQRSQWGFSADDIILLAMSRMEPRKNHASVLRSISDLRHQGLSVVGVFASEGEEKGKLKKLSCDLGIDDYVSFPGYVNDRVRVLSFSAADIHVLPSIQVGSMIEGYGIVFIEAAAAGTPSISGNVGGQAEAVIDGTTGFVVDGTDQNQLTMTIKKLVTSPDLRIRMGAAGKEWARENDWSSISTRTFELLGQYGLI